MAAWGFRSYTLPWPDDKNEDGLEVEGDVKHCNTLLEEWGMSQARPVDTPMVKHERNAEAQEMSPQEATRFRRAVARLSYMAQDRGDLSYAASHLASYMARPRVELSGY